MVRGGARGLVLAMTMLSVVLAGCLAPAPSASPTKDAPQAEDPATAPEGPRDRAGPRLPHAPPLDLPLIRPPTLGGSQVVEFGQAVEFRTFPVDRNRRGVETIVTEDAAGTLWVAGMTCRDCVDANLWKGGITGFTHEDPPSGGQGDATVFYADGWLHYAELCCSPVTLLLARRDPDLSPPAAWGPVEDYVGYDRPWFTAQGASTYLVITAVVQNNTDHVALFTSLDDGQTWSIEAIPGTSGFFGHAPQALPDGTLVVPLGEFGVFPPDVPALRAAVRPPGGPWTIEDVGSSPPHPHAASDAAGNVYVTTTTAGRIGYYVRSASGTWSGPVPVSTEGDEVTLPALAAGAEGALAVAWYAKSPDSLAWEVRAHFVRQAHTGSPTFLGEVVAAPKVADGGLDAGDFLHMTKRSDGSVVIAYSCKTSLPPVVVEPHCGTVNEAHPWIAVQTEGEGLDAP